ncbi:hypothetical protein HIM_08755 [Hirsutella minnesotensis 3608]|uniref:Uncharacterized protein n=1 Tax=Hirsutella minnesotensis 3608 TaxID=1043627 RepID=A0A0F7ZY44_9HYPO|nr:hypothetical protein HIM_08755 [Hirsutella minnesotensis 3608]
MLFKQLIAIAFLAGSSVVAMSQAPEAAVKARAVEGGAEDNLVARAEAANAADPCPAPGFFYHHGQCCRRRHRRGHPWVYYDCHRP